MTEAVTSRAPSAHRQQRLRDRRRRGAVLLRLEPGLSTRGAGDPEALAGTTLDALRARGIRLQAHRFVEGETF